MENSITAGQKATFSSFLAEHHAVAREKVKFYLYWVDRFIRRPRPPDEADDNPDSLTRFLDDLGRQKEPWQVKQVQEAVRMFLYYRASQPYAPMSTRAAESAPGPSLEDVAAWDAMCAEMRRILRVKRLSMETERTYPSWLRQFRQWYNERAPLSVTSAAVRNFLSYLAVERRVAAVTQNQDFNSLLFFMRNCLKQDPKDLNGSVRAPVRRRLVVDGAGAEWYDKDDVNGGQRKHNAGT